MPLRTATPANLPNALAHGLAAGNQTHGGINRKPGCNFGVANRAPTGMPSSFTAGRSGKTGAGAISLWKGLFHLNLPQRGKDGASAYSGERK